MVSSITENITIFGVRTKATSVGVVRFGEALTISFALTTTTWKCPENQKKTIFEDGQENVFDESWNEAMDWDEEVDPYILENLTNLTCYVNKQIQPEMDPRHPGIC
ncbi:hypothetical protein BY458DRAFT_547067 [Sporodiniella umbellata]|nr:hypothetical protein BY458DRAFT_547067 [Sporodiniella umbellata]